MNPFIPYLIAAGVAALIIGGFVLGRRIERKGMQAANAAYERLLTIRDGEYADLLDRFFLKQKQPPQGADLLTFDEENRAEQRERRSTPGRVGTQQLGNPVHRTRVAMLAQDQHDNPSEQVA